MSARKKAVPNAPLAPKPLSAKQLARTAERAKARAVRESSRRQASLSRALAEARPEDFPIALRVLDAMAQTSIGLAVARVVPKPPEAPKPAPVLPTVSAPLGTGLDRTALARLVLEHAVTARREAVDTLVEAVSTLNGSTNQQDGKANDGMWRKSPADALNDVRAAYNTVTNRMDGEKASQKQFDDIRFGRAA